MKYICLDIVEINVVKWGILKDQNGVVYHLNAFNMIFKNLQVS